MVIFRSIVTVTLVKALKSKYLKGKYKHVLNSQPFDLGKS